MWPKVFAQLVELLPHVSRLVPMADKFFASKTASEKANEAAMAALAEGVRGDLGQVTAAHAGLYRQLQELGAQNTEVAGEARRARVAVESFAERVDALEKNVASLGVWVKVGTGLIVVALGLLVAILVAAIKTS